MNTTFIPPNDLAKLRTGARDAVAELHRFSLPEDDDDKGTAAPAPSASTEEPAMSATPKLKRGELPEKVGAAHAVLVKRLGREHAARAVRRQILRVDPRGVASPELVAERRREAKERFAELAFSLEPRPALRALRRHRRARDAKRMLDESRSPSELAEMVEMAGETYRG